MWSTRPNRSPRQHRQVSSAQVISARPKASPGVVPVAGGGSRIVTTSRSCIRLGWVERNRAAHRREPPQRRRTRGRHRPGQRVACGCRVRACRRAGIERRRDQREDTSIGRRSPRQGDRCVNRERFDQSRDQSARQRSRRHATAGCPAGTPGQLASKYHHQSPARRTGLYAGRGETLQHQRQLRSACSIDLPHWRGEEPRSLSPLHEFCC